MLRLLFVILVIFFSFQNASAAQRQCSDLFFRLNKPVAGEARPDRVLPLLGLRETTGLYGEKNQSFVVIKPRVSRVAQLISEFQKKRPALHFFYSTDRTGFTDRIKVLMQMGQRATHVHIPLGILANEKRLEWHLESLDHYLSRIDFLLNEPIDFIVTEMTSIGFTLDIEGFRGQPVDRHLAWMWRRQERHQLKFAFTNFVLDPNFNEDNMGMSIGRHVYMADYLLFSDTVRFPAFLAHEIVHSTNFALFKKYGDAARRIMFYAGKNNTKGLFERSAIHDGYAKSFPTDEMEAWLMTERLGMDVEGEMNYKDFLYNQIEWLEELKRELMGRPDISIAQNGEHLYTLDFTIYRGTPKEVVITIPFVDQRVREMGLYNYLKDLVGRRLKQLNHRAELATRTSTMDASPE